jgi:hypothetical protein
MPQSLQNVRKVRPANAWAGLVTHSNSSLLSSWAVVLTCDLPQQLSPLVPSNDLFLEALARHEPHIAISLLPRSRLLICSLRIRMQHNPVSRLLSMRAESQIKRVEQSICRGVRVCFEVSSVRHAPVRFVDDAVGQLKGFSGGVHWHHVGDFIP